MTYAAGFCVHRISVHSTMDQKTFGKKLPEKAWRDGSSVKSGCCSGRGAEFGSPHSSYVGWLQLLLTPPPGDLMCTNTYTQQNPMECVVNDFIDTFLLTVSYRVQCGNRSDHHLPGLRN